MRFEPDIEVFRKRIRSIAHYGMKIKFWTWGDLGKKIAIY
jgi:hypothetical protein